MKVPPGHHLLPFENVQLTRGHGRTLLVDLQRQGFEFLDNTLYTLLVEQARAVPFERLLSDYDAETQEAILEYVAYLLQEEYVFWCAPTEVPLFPRLTDEWDDPAQVANAIIDFKAVPESLEPYQQFITELDALGCENIQLRDFNGLPIGFWQEMLPLFEGTVVHRISIVTKYPGSLEAYQPLLKQFARVSELIIHSAHATQLVPTGSDQVVIVTKETVTDASHCGFVSTKQFNLHLHHYLESQRYNTCLNRKISVDAEGQIKACPAMQTSYGKVGEVSLREIIQIPELRALYTLSKDQIEDCQVCEFRHICTDCRAHHEEDHSRKKPKHCQYNPYTMQWEGETTDQES